MPIYPDKNTKGELTGRFRIEVQANGRRLRDRRDTLEAAKAREGELLALLSEAPQEAPRRVEQGTRPETLGELIKVLPPIIWRGSPDLDDKIAPRLREIRGILGDVPLGSLSLPHLDTLVTALLSRSLAPSTINKYLSHFNKLLTEARRRRWVAEVPEAPWLEETEGRIRWMTADEEATLIALMHSYGHPELAALIWAANRTGMRWGEFETLTPEALKADLGDHGYVVVWADKAKSGETRMIPLGCPEVVEALKVFLSSKPPYHTLRHFWGRAAREMGLEDDPGWSFHVTRHTAATRLVRAGVNLRVVQRYMGHKSIETTLRYTHVDDDLLMEAARVLVGVQAQQSLIPVSLSSGGFRVGETGPKRPPQLLNGDRYG